MELTCLDILMNIYEKNFETEKTVDIKKSSSYHELTNLDILLKILQKLEREEKNNQINHSIYFQLKIRNTFLKKYKYNKK